jgi:predicted transcriptional regulator of viral defense system
MQTLTELALQKVDRGIFTREQAALWVGNSGARLDALLKRAVASQEVRRIRRGLYCLSEKYTRLKINPLELTQRIHGPSYISLETALSYHSWIPEAVQAVTSVSVGRSRTFNTSIGLFSFTRVPQRRFLAGVRRISLNEGSNFFMAIPLKALADYVYVHQLDWYSSFPVVESLRIEYESLIDLSGDLFDEVMSAYKPGRVLRLLTGLRKDLKL